MFLNIYFFYRRIKKVIVIIIISSSSSSIIIIIIIVVIIIIIIISIIMSYVFQLIMYFRFRTSYNHFHNILRLFDFLPNFPVTKSETMGDYFLKTWYIQVVSRVAERLKT